MKVKAVKVNRAHYFLTDPRINTASYDIKSSQQTLRRYMRTKPAQLRANKSPLLRSYLPTVKLDTYTPQCPLCLAHTHMHDTNHLF